MTQSVLALMLAGFLALSPTLQIADKRKQHPPANPRAIRGEPCSSLAVVAQRVMILDRPFEPRYTYIRVDNAVYALSLGTSDTLG